MKYAILLASLAAAQYNPLAGPWVVQWQDDFDGPAGSQPNSAVWNVANNPGLSGNKELEYYSPSHVYQDGHSNLVLLSTPTQTDGFNYTSGWVDSKGKWNGTSNAKFEVRAKLPTGQGIWPAHWLLPDYKVCWPVGGEIDILERIDTVQAVHGALHWSQDGECGDVKEGNAGGWSPDLPFDPSADFHLYAVVWNSTTDRIDYCIDELCYANATGVSTLFPQKPFYWILNTAVGGSWPGSPNASTIWPQLHLIDYVRYYVRP